MVFIAKKENRILQRKSFDGSVKNIYDIEAVAKMMLKNFFDGKLGKLFFDSDFLVEKTNDEMNHFM